MVASAACNCNRTVGVWPTFFAMTEPIPAESKNTLRAAMVAYKATFAALAPSTRERYEFPLEQFEYFARRASVVDTALWGRYLSHLVESVGPATARRNATIVKAFFQWCEDTGRIERTPCRGKFRLPNAPHKDRLGFTPEEYAKLKSACDDSHYKLIVTSYWTGLSLGDASSLRRSSVDLDNLMLRVHRGKMLTRAGVECQIPIPPNGDLFKLLDVAMRRTEFPPPPRVPLNPELYVFPELARDYEANPNAVSQGINAAIRRAGISGKTFKNLRNGLCSALANSGVNLVIACEITGHKDPKIFRGYVTASRSAIAEAGRRLHEVLRGQPTMPQEAV